MHLDAGLDIDVDGRLRQQLTGLPPRVTLIGNPMHRAIAARLIATHAPRCAITDDGEPLHLCSLEAYGARQLAAFLDGRPWTERTLLSAVPERALIAYAERHGIPVVHEERDALRDFIEEIARTQPQTPFSLARSMRRLGDPPGRRA